ncbi:MAG: exopolysaccharide biosynthesis protein [Clostridia bacterium]|nr:exopolysaccharide biosynthesis protein [Clostridia bacterium]
MILVLLGTQNNSFTRLLEAIQSNIDNNVIQEEVIVQAGFTKFQSDDMKIFNLIDKNELSELQDRADLIITHGGVGSIISSLKKGKKVIVVPRLKKFDEHVNNHQLQIARRFEQEGYVKYVINIKNLEKVIKSIDKFVPRKYESDESNIITIIENFIDNN